MGIRIIDANFIVKVAEHAWDKWNLAMATQDTNRGVNKVLRRQELCKAVKAVADDAPTIDPESLPIVQELRKKLEQVTAERDAALGRKVYVTARYDGDGLTVYRHDAENLNDSRCVVMVKYTAAAANVGYSENGKDGPYKTAMNVDEFGVLTMANDVARALFGYAERKEAHP